MNFPIRHPDFTTVTCLDWKSLLEGNCYKELLIEKWDFLEHYLG